VQPSGGAVRFESPRGVRSARRRDRVLVTRRRRRKQTAGTLIVNQLLASVQGDRAISFSLARLSSSRRWCCLQFCFPGHVRSGVVYTDTATLFCWRQFRSISLNSGSLALSRKQATTPHCQVASMKCRPTYPSSPPQRALHTAAATLALTERGVHALHAAGAFRAAAAAVGGAPPLHF
jgi:hypothetical protein